MKKALNFSFIMIIIILSGCAVPRKFAVIPQMKEYEFTVEEKFDTLGYVPASDNRNSLERIGMGPNVQDTIKQKIIFKQKSSLESLKIELLSSNQFKHLGETNFIGERGINLKKVMGNNIESISMVDKAYRKKSSGMPLIIIGGAVSFAGLVLLEMYNQDTQLSTVPNKSFLTSGITLSITGLVSMAIGFKNHGSLTRDLGNSISVYNNRLIEHKTENNNEDQNRPDKK